MRRRPVKSEVKDGSSTIAVPLILMGLNKLEVGGMRQVAVKCIDMSQNTDCEGSLLCFIDAEARKRGDQTGLDTLVVHALNDEYSLLAIYS